MASYSVEEFLGNGSLKSLLPKLIQDGWDDVPTLKLMNSDDMLSLNLTKDQKDALEIRSYLHDRALMVYADKLEACKKCLDDILNMSIADISANFGMKRGHIARFMSKTLRSLTIDPLALASTYSFQTRTHNMAGSRNNSTKRMPSRTLSVGRTSSSFEVSIEQSLSELKIKDGHIFKGFVSSMSAEPRGCGCVQPTTIIENVASLSTIEKISIKQLTPLYDNNVGIQPLVKTKTTPVKAFELWRDKPAVILCIRRPGCIMCRAEAHQLFSRKPLFDALGVQLFAVIHEYIDSELKDFWPRYWGGGVLHDKNMNFFKALGGGKLLKDSFISGFLFNPRAIANYRRAKAMGIKHNFNGEGEIKGGLFIVGKGKSGIAYQFIERNFGDWAPLSEVIEICSRLQNQNQSLSESMKSPSMD